MTAQAARNNIKTTKVTAPRAEIMNSNQCLNVLYVGNRKRGHFTLNDFIPMHHMQRYEGNETFYASQSSWDKNFFKGGEFDAGASHALQGHIGDSRAYKCLGTSSRVNWTILAPIMAHGSLKNYNVVKSPDKAL